MIQVDADFAHWICGPGAVNDTRPVDFHHHRFAIRFDPQILSGIAVGAPTGSGVPVPAREQAAFVTRLQMRETVQVCQLVQNVNVGCRGPRLTNATGNPRGQNKARGGQRVAEPECFVAGIIW